MALIQLKMVLRDEPKPRPKPHTKTSPQNQKTSMPRETEKHSLINLMIGGKQISGTYPGGQNQDGHGVMKSEGFF